MGTDLVSGNARMGIKNAFMARAWSADEAVSAARGTERDPDLRHASTSYPAMLHMTLATAAGPTDRV
jgi:hypothetical protein